MTTDFDGNTINDVWQKGVKIDGYNPDLYRQDACGAWIMRSEYTNTDSILGWQIDHIFPQSRGGNNSLVNLRPMHHQNNLSKSDNYPTYTAVIKAEGNKNVKKETEFTVNEELQKTLEKLYKTEK